MRAINSYTTFLLGDHPAARRERLRRRVARHAAVHGRTAAADWQTLTDPSQDQAEAAVRLAWLLVDDLHVLRLRLRAEELLLDRPDLTARFATGASAAPPGWNLDPSLPYPSPPARAVQRALHEAVLTQQLTPEQADQRRWSLILGLDDDPDLAPAVAAELLYIPADHTGGVDLARVTARTYADAGVALGKELGTLGPQEVDQFDQLTDRMNWYTWAGRQLAEAVERTRQQHRRQLLGRAADARALATLPWTHTVVGGLTAALPDPAQRYTIQATVEYLPASVLYQHVHDSVRLIDRCPPDRTTEIRMLQRAQQDLLDGQAASQPAHRQRRRRTRRSPAGIDDPASQPRQDILKHRLADIDEQLRELNEHQHHHMQWVAANASTLLTGRAAAEELLNRMTRLWRELTEHPPPYLEARLGLPGTNPGSRTAWLHAAQTIERYRAEFDVQDLTSLFGDKPTSPHQRRQRAAATQALRKARTIGVQHHLIRQPAPPVSHGLEQTQ